MKAITKNLVLFSVGLIILTVVFRYLLSAMLQNRQFATVWEVAVAYGIIVFFLGWVFGKQDRLTLPLYDVGFRFHLATYLLCNIVAEAWYLFGFQSDYEKISAVHWTVIIWGIFLLIHYGIYLLTRKNTIKGIKKSDLFE